MPFRRQPAPETLNQEVLPVAETTPKVMGTSNITCDNPLLTPTYPSDTEFVPIVVDLESIRATQAGPNGYLDPLTTKEAFSRILLSKGYQASTQPLATPAEVGLFDTLLSYLETGIKSHFTITSPTSVEIPDEVQKWDTGKILVTRLHALNNRRGPNRQPHTLKSKFTPNQPVLEQTHITDAEPELATTLSKSTATGDTKAAERPPRFLTPRQIRVATIALAIAGVISDRRKR